MLFGFLDINLLLCCLGIARLTHFANPFKWFRTFNQQYSLVKLHININICLDKSLTTYNNCLL